MQGPAQSVCFCLTTARNDDAHSASAQQQLQRDGGCFDSFSASQLLQDTLALTAAADTLTLCWVVQGPGSVDDCPVTCSMSPRTACTACRLRLVGYGECI